MTYTKEKIIDDCEKELKCPENFYKAPFINYKGKCSNTKEYYTEVIAKFLCEHIDEFINGFEGKMVTREGSYNVGSHKGEHGNSNRTEEITAMDMFNHCKKESYDHIGKIIDYQIPLKNSSEDGGLGKIDLLSWGAETLRILELKKPDSKETMLRCVLEGYTYLRIVDTEKLAKNFEHEGAEVKASPFVFVNDKSNPYNEMKEERPWLKKLMELLDSKPYYIVGEFPYKITDKI